MVKSTTHNIDQAVINLQLLIWYRNPSQFYKDLYNEEPYYYQDVFFKDVEKLNRMMLLSAAGIGKTKLLSCVALWLSIVYASIKKKKYDVLILSGSNKQAKKLYEYSSEPLQNHPILSTFVKGEILTQSVKFTNGSTVRALPKSLKSIQGEHVNCVIVDEAALVDDFTLMDTNRIIGGQAQNPDNKLIYSGTPTIYNSLYVAMWEDEKKYPDYFKALPENRNDLLWARYTWAARDCKRFKPEEIEQMKRDLGDEKFSIFWEGKPYPMTNTVVDVKHLRKQSIGYDRFVYNFTTKIGKIVFGIDWGMTDKTVLIIAWLIDDETSPVKYRYKILECVHWKGEHYDNVHQWIAHYADIYKPDYIFVDLNPKGESDRCVQTLSPKGYFVQPINLGSERSTLQARMKYIFEHEAIFVPQDFVDLLNNIKVYTWDKTKGDDYVTAIMLALKDIAGNNEDFTMYYKVSRINRTRY